MSGLFGWVGFEASRESSLRIIQKMGAGSHPGKSGSNQWTADTAALATNGTIEPTAMHEQADLVAAVVGAPYFSDPELSASVEENGVAAAVAQGFRKRGPAFLESVRGGFALAVIRPRSNELFLAIDRIGGRYPLRYKVAGDSVIFASDGDAIQAHPIGASELDPNGIYSFVYFHVVAAPRTVRRNVKRLLSGSYLHASGGLTRIRSYWQPEYRDQGRASTPELEREFRELLRDSVRRAAEGENAGCFLSGGTDSSAVAGTLGEVTERPSRTYSIGFQAKGYDEMEYAREAAGHFGTDHHEYYLTPDDAVELIPRIAQAYSDPFGNASAVPAFFCARLARENGVECMLAGDGGDELFAGNKPYAKQKVFAFYHRIPRPLRAAILEPVTFGFPMGESILPVRKLRSYIRQANVPMPRRAQSYNHLDRLGHATVMTSDFLATVDTEEPLRMQTETYEGALADNMVNRMLAMSLRFTLADNDLPKVSRMCELAGVRVAYPLLSDELVEFTCRLPADLKVKGLKLRWFYKHALRDFLPEKILRKTKHGFGMPFGFWMRDHPPLRELAMDNLNDLKARHIVRSDFIDKLLRLHEADHAPYYGVFIWVFVQLEQWFKAHVDRVATTG